MVKIKCTGGTCYTYEMGTKKYLCHITNLRYLLSTVNTIILSISSILICPRDNIKQHFLLVKIWQSFFVNFCDSRTMPFFLQHHLPGPLQIQLLWQHAKRVQSFRQTDWRPYWVSYIISFFSTYNPISFEITVNFFWYIMKIIM